ncbi:hypothetical protein [Amycolatopsis sp. cmx-11-12]|uniref:hypothetical protein n=1 Tax=Amycolatopsis sp. cmx-11-12 TaxID=2785795 RepID=UPI003917CFE8
MSDLRQLVCRELDRDCRMFAVVVDHDGELDGFEQRAQRAGTIQQCSGLTGGHGRALGHTDVAP